MNEVNQEEEIHLKNQISELWKREELYWKQKSRVKWLTRGDQNTTFFHVTTNSRRRRNMFTQLKGSKGVWITNERGIMEEIRGHYERAFTYEKPELNSEVLKCVTPDKWGDEPAIDEGCHG